MQERPRGWEDMGYESRRRYLRAAGNEGRDDSGDPMFVGGDFHPAYKGPWRDNPPAHIASFLRSRRR